MFLHCPGKRRALANRFGDLHYHFFQGGILFLFAKPFQPLRNGNGGTKQRAHLARESGDFFAADPVAQAGRRRMRGLFLGFQIGRRLGRLGGAAFQVRREETALAQKLKRCPAIRRLDYALDRAAASFDGLISEGAHSCKSPEETRRISSSVVIPSAALRNASWCIVIMVFCAAALSSALDRF